MTGYGLLAQLKNAGNTKNYNSLTTTTLIDFLTEISTSAFNTPRQFKITTGFMGMINFDIIQSLLEYKQLSYRICNFKKVRSVQIDLGKYWQSYKIVVKDTPEDEELNRPYLVQLRKGTEILCEFNTIRDAVQEYYNRIKFNSL